MHIPNSKSDNGCLILGLNLKLNGFNVMVGLEYWKEKSVSIPSFVYLPVHQCQVHGIMVRDTVNR